MTSRTQFCSLLCAVIVASASNAAQSGSNAGQQVERPAGGVVDFLAPILSDPILQHSKEIYVLYGCAYCHGVDLKVRNGEAADLLHSNLVAADQNANLIGPLLRNGIPQTAKLSPMPQFSDLSEREIADIARWIHYARQQSRYKELMDAKDLGPGDAAAGKIYFDKMCASCHRPDDMIKVVKSNDAATLKSQLLNPAFMKDAQSFNVDQLHDPKIAAGRQRHGKLLENYFAKEVSNLIAYVQTMK